MEYFILFFLVSYFVILIAVSFGMNTITLQEPCGGCHPRADDPNCSDRCIWIFNLYKQIYKFSAIAGMVIVCIKAVVAIYILKFLKNHLNFYYKLKKNGIILAVILSLISNTFKFFSYFILNFQNTGIKNKFGARIDMNLVQFSYGFILSIFSRLLPILVLIFNIRVIYFTWYMENLMKGWNLEQYLTICSIFMHKTKNKSKLYEENEESLWLCRIKQPNSWVTGALGDKCKCRESFLSQISHDR